MIKMGILIFKVITNTDIYIYITRFLFLKRTNITNMKIIARGMITLTFSCSLNVIQIEIID